MELLEQVKSKLDQLGRCDSSYVLAHSAWSACSHDSIPGASSLDVSSGLDDGNKELIDRLNRITLEFDYSNSDQYEMLIWLNEKGFTSYISNQLSEAIKSLDTWEKAKVVWEKMLDGQV